MYRPSAIKQTLLSRVFDSFHNVTLMINVRLNLELEFY
jgi:hypothetical protein